MKFSLYETIITFGSLITPIYRKVKKSISIKDIMIIHLAFFFTIHF